MIMEDYWLSLEERRQWDNLLRAIKNGDVIPVISTDFLEEGGHTLQDALKETSKFGADCTSFSELSDVVSRKYKHSDGIYYALGDEYSKKVYHPSNLLKRLLAIRYFPFIITTSYFPVVEQVMREIWGSDRLKVYNFTLNNKTDLQNPDDLRKPSVYYMFGRLSSEPHGYALTDSDMLMYCKAWLSNERPKNLSNELKDKYLLFFGSEHSDWLFRFIWYSMNQTEEGFSPTTGMVFREHEDSELSAFLKRLDTVTKKDPESVISKIEEGLKEYDDDEKFDVPRNYTDVFISYSRKNPELAACLYEKLTSKGLNVWYDRKALFAGDDWKKKIEEAIKTSKFFVPLITKGMYDEAQDYHEYVCEWKIAVSHSQGFTRKFILPLSQTESGYYDAVGVLPEFKNKQTVFFEDDKDTVIEEFADLVRKFVIDMKNK